jgi:hypothetical protein
MLSFPKWQATSLLQTNFILQVLAFHCYLELPTHLAQSARKTYERKNHSCDVLPQQIE